MSTKRVSNRDVAMMLTEVLGELKGLRANVDMLARTAFQIPSVSHTATNLAAFPVGTVDEESVPSDSFTRRLNEVYGNGWRPPADEESAS